jgi:hypothetical protein
VTWFKVDDRLCIHDKARAAGLRAMGLWVMAGSHSASVEADGFVPEWFVASFPTGRRDAVALVDVGLWTKVAGGWQFHEWDELNPTHAELESQREAGARRQRRARNAARNGVTGAETDDVTDAETVGGGFGVSPRDPTRPLVTRGVTDADIDTNELDPADLQLDLSAISTDDELVARTISESRDTLKRRPSSSP